MCYGIAENAGYGKSRHEDKIEGMTLDIEDMSIDFR